MTFLSRAEGGRENLAQSLGTIASLVVWLIGLTAILNLFALTEVLAPLQAMLAGILAALPRIIGAAMLLFIGVVLGKIVRELIVTALRAANIDRFAGRLGARVDHEPGTDATAHPTGSSVPGVDGRSSRGRMDLAMMIGRLASSVIVIVVAIAALRLLGIQSISDPATHMLQLILDAIPLILGACILLAIGVVIARFVGTLLDSILRGFDLDGAARRLGVDTGRIDLVQLLVRVVQIAIVLFFAVAATTMLHFPEITAMLNAILGLAGRVIFGAVVIMAGVFLANLLKSLVGGQAGEIVKIGTVVLFVAMGLKYMGLADSIVNLAFGALVVGAAAAAALAFGLGGRDAAARQLQRLQSGGGSSPVRFDDL